MVVGDCFLHNVMEGEAMRDYNGNGIELFIA